MKELTWIYEGIDYSGNETFKYVCKNGDVLKAFKHIKGWVLTSTFNGHISPSEFFVIQFDIWSDFLFAQKESISSSKILLDETENFDDSSQNTMLATNSFSFYMEE